MSSDRSQTRHVPFDGVTNFRDLGGYATADGGATRWGRVFRSDSLHRLTPDDVIAFDGLGIRTVFDLRRPDEWVQEPGPRRCVCLELPSRNLADTDLATLRDRSDGERWLYEEYRGTLQAGARVVGRLLRAVAEQETGPVLFHCNGGKDRRDSSLPFSSPVSA